MSKWFDICFWPDQTNLGITLDHWSWDCKESELTFHHYHHHCHSAEMGEIVDSGFHKLAKGMRKLPNILTQPLDPIYTDWGENWLPYIYIDSVGVEWKMFEEQRDMNLVPIIVEVRWNCKDGKSFPDILHTISTNRRIEREGARNPS